MEEYKLHIYHRAKAIEKDAEGNTIIGSSPGHPFVALQHGKDYKYFGKYPQTENIGDFIKSDEVISPEEGAILEELKTLTDKTGEDYVTFKTFKLTEGQYSKALNYVMQRSTLKKKNQYTIGFCDCVDFVQDVYNAAGLPLYFTVAYTATELLQLKTLAAAKILLRYGSRSTMPSQFHIIEADTKEELAESLNVDVSRIVPIPIFFGWDIQDLKNSNATRFHVNVDDILPLAESIIENPSNTDNLKEMKNELLQIFSESQIKVDNDDKLIKIDNPGNINLIGNVPTEFLKLKHVVRYELLRYKENFESVLKQLHKGDSATEKTQKQILAMYEEKMSELQAKFKSNFADYQRNPQQFPLKFGETLPGMKMFNEESLKINQWLQEQLATLQGTQSHDYSTNNNDGLKKKWNASVKKLSEAAEFTENLRDSLNNIEMVKKIIRDNMARHCN